MEAIVFLCSCLILILIWVFVEKGYILLVKYLRKTSEPQKPVSGGGFLIPLAVLLFYLLERRQGVDPVTGFIDQAPMTWLWGLLILCVVSGWDDFRALPVFPRIAAQLLAVGLLFWQFAPTLGSVDVQWWNIAIAAIFAIGFLNMWNFMDGINGITGWMTLATLLPAMSLCEFHYIQWGIGATIIPPTIAFLGFNCRRKAACYAGDIGAISIAYILLFVWGSNLSQLWNVGEPAWWSVVFFAVYLVDAGWTIVLRLKRRENIFKPHLNHAYQHLCHRLGWNPVVVSVLFAATQLSVSLIAYTEAVQQYIYWYVTAVFVALTGTYFYIISRPAKVEVSPTYAR